MCHLNSICRLLLTAFSTHQHERLFIIYIMAAKKVKKARLILGILFVIVLAEIGIILQVWQPASNSNNNDNNNNQEEDEIAIRSRLREFSQKRISIHRNNDDVDDMNKNMNVNMKKKNPSNPLTANTAAAAAVPNMTRNKGKDKVKVVQDEDCIFRQSPLYRSVFVYPSPGEPEWHGSILSEHGQKRKHNDDNANANDNDDYRYPWQAIDERTKRNAEYHYRIRDSRAIQYTTEILVREILTHPQSCLRTYDPDEATLFYVPYMASIEWHNGTQYPKSFETSPYGQAILDVLDNNIKDYTGWETLFGWTSRYWKRKQGADHILVMSEPCHGLWHPRSRPGNFVYIHAQQQLAPPIIVSKDISRTFVDMYPHCARKNIVLPHPNTDGRWFNGRVDEVAQQMAHMAGLDHTTNTNDDSPDFRLPNDPSGRGLPYYYKAGNHGMCRAVRLQLEEAFEGSPMRRYLQEQQQRGLLPKGSGGYYRFSHAYRHATFCPCPGGDAPSAKRMFDALFAGCIPIILSQDFAWPFTKEIPGSPELLDPKDFSIRWNASDFLVALEDDLSSTNSTTATTTASSRMLGVLEGISSSEISRLQRGVQTAAKLYAYYPLSSPNLPDNSLRDNVLPNGGAAQALVAALADRAGGQRWPACQQEVIEMDPDNKDTVDQFKC
jgi:hypothetical protein